MSVCAFTDPTQWIIKYHLSPLYRTTCRFYEYGQLSSNTATRRVTNNHVRVSFISGYLQKHILGEVTKKYRLQGLCIGCFDLNNVQRKGASIALHSFQNVIFISQKTGVHETGSYPCNHLFGGLKMVQDVPYINYHQIMPHEIIP